MNLFFRPIPVALVSLFCASLVQAETYSLSVAQKNNLYQPFNGAGSGTVAATAATAFGPPGVGTTTVSNSATYPATANSNNVGMGQSGGSSRANSSSTPYYPGNSTRDLSASTGTTLMLRSSERLASQTPVETVR